MSNHQAKQTQSDQVFKIKYSACSGDSAYHDLQCNHRIRSSDLSESCGANCVKAARANPFVCPDCVVNDVRLEMDFQGLTLLNNHDHEMLDDGPTRVEKIRAIADAEVTKRLAQGYRMCKVTRKFEDPKLQFFHDFLVEEGYDGIGEVDKTLTSKPKTVFKRPGLNSILGKKKSSVWMPRDSDLNGGQTTGALFAADQEDELINRNDEAATSDRTDMERNWEDFQTRFPAQSDPFQGSSLDDLLGDLGSAHISTPLEDDATKAVREALQRCALSAATAGE